MYEVNTILEELEAVLEKHNVNLDSCSCCGGIRINRSDTYDVLYTTVSIHPTVPQDEPVVEHEHEWELSTENELYKEHTCNACGTVKLSVAGLDY